MIMVHWLIATVDIQLINKPTKAPLTIKTKRIARILLSFRCSRKLITGDKNKTFNKVIKEMICRDGVMKKTENKKIRTKKNKNS